MGKGVNQYWTPGVELEYEEHIKRCRSFAERHLMATIRDMLKYDHRTRAGKRATAQSRLRLATATDQDLKELAQLKVHLLQEADIGTAEEVLGQLNKDRARVREEGFKRSEIECQ